VITSFVRQILALQKTAADDSGKEQRRLPEPPAPPAPSSPPFRGTKAPPPAMSRGVSKTQRMPEPPDPPAPSSPPSQADADPMTEYLKYLKTDRKSRQG